MFNNLMMKKNYGDFKFEVCCVGLVVCCFTSNFVIINYLQLIIFLISIAKETNAGLKYVI